MKHDHGPDMNPRRRRRRSRMRRTTSAWMALMQRQYLKQFGSFLMLEMERNGPFLPLPWQTVKMAADRSLAMVASLSSSSSSSSSSSHFEWASHLFNQTGRLDPNGYLPQPSAVKKRRIRTSHAGLLQRARRRKRAHSIIRQIRACTHDPISADGDEEEEPLGSVKWAKWRELQTLIPGGNYMEPPKLLKEMSHYILFLQMQSRSLNDLLTTQSA